MRVSFVNSGFNSGNIVKPSFMRIPEMTSLGLTLWVMDALYVPKPLPVPEVRSRVGDTYMYLYFSNDAFLTITGVFSGAQPVNIEILHAMRKMR